MPGESWPSPGCRQSFPTRTKGMRDRLPFVEIDASCASSIRGDSFGFCEGRENRRLNNQSITLNLGLTCRKSTGMSKYKKIRPRKFLVQKHRSIERVALHRLESRIANDAAQLFFRSAIRGSCCLYDIFFEHDGADIVAAEAQAQLQNLQSLRDPARLHILDIGKIEARDGQDFQIFDCCSLIPSAAAERRIVRLKAPGDECGEAAGFFLQTAYLLKEIDTLLDGLAD